MTAPTHSFSKSVAALLATLPMSLCASIALSSVLPLTAAARALLAMYAVFPLWLVCACVGLLASRARRVWWSIATLATLSVLIAYAFERRS